MSKFGLLDKVYGITGKTISNINQTPIIEETEMPTQSQPFKKIKTLSDITTLEVGDMIIDDEGTKRWVVAVNSNRVTLTGKKATGPNSYKKVFVWSQEKIDEAVEDRGFRLA